MTKILLLCLTALFFVSGCTKFEPAAPEERTTEIGLLMRRQFTNDVTEQRRCRHIDILLANHEIMGFNVAAPEVNFIKYLLIHTPGKVRKYEDLDQIRKYYIYADKAMDVTRKGKSGLKMVTWWTHLRVTPTQAKRLQACWEEIAANPPEFRLFGDNCASRAAESLVCAGILPPGLPGLDTPENVLKRVREFYPEITVEEGYFGFDKERKPYIIPLVAVHPELTKNQTQAD